jgi:hypothetical protein
MSAFECKADMAYCNANVRLRRCKQLRKHVELRTAVVKREKRS